MSPMPAEAFEWREYVQVDAPPPPPPHVSTYSAEVLADAPLLYWHLDETSGAVAADATAAARNGGYTGTYALGASPLIDTGTALDLRASPGGAVSIAAAAWMPTTVLTVECWAQREGAAHNGKASGYLVARDIVAGQFGLRSFYLEWANDGSLLWRGFGGSAARFTLASPVLGSGRHHIVATYDGANARIYVDGAQVATVAAAGTLNAAQNLTAGAAGASNDGTDFRRFNGLLDEVAVYGTALTAARVAAHYTAGSVVVPDPEPVPGPVYGWEPHADRSHALASFSVTYGRPDAHSRCKPLQTSVELAGELAGACPPSGERFRLSLSAAAAAALGLTEEEAALFTGEVTDPTVEPVDRTYSITGMGRLGRGSRRTLATKDWKQELDGARVARVLARANLEAGVVDPGTVELLPPDGDASAGNLLETVTDSSGGSLVEQPDGAIDYHDANHRRGTPVTVTIDASQLDNRLSWEQRVDDLINEMTVAWADGQVVARDASSISTRDEFPGRVTTALTSASAAHSLGQLVVARRSEPVWQLPNLEVDLMRMVDDALRASLLRLRHGDRIKVTGIPLAHPYSGDVEFYVEGSSMRVDRPIPEQPWRWKLRLSVSDPALSGVSLRWIDMPVGRSWDSLAPGLSWFDLARIESPADL